MRFVCDSCRAQYMISDDKIGAKGVKVRCKKCGYVITVRASGTGASKEEGAQAAAEVETVENKEQSAVTSFGLPATMGSPPEGGLFTDVEEDEIGAVFDQVLSSGSQKIPAGESLGEAEAKSANDTVRKLAEAESEEGEPKTPASAHEWYVAIDEKQVGPLSVEKVKDHWDRGEVGPDSLCWRSGFGDWIPLSEVAELASVLAPRPSSKPLIVAPAAVSSSTPTVPAPVESAFSAGSASKSARADSPLSASASGEETPGWKPSAASVLASLVKEENEALSRPPPKPAPVVDAPKPVSTGLLDLPPPPESMPAAAVPAPAPVAAVPVQAPVMAPPPAAAPYAPAAAPYAPPPAAPYAQPGYPAYPPPAAAPPPSGNKMAIIGAVAAVVLLSIGGGVVYMMTRPSAPVVPGGAVAAVTPGTEPVQPTNVPPTPPANTVKPAEALPVPSAPAGTAQTAPAAGTPAVAGAQQPATTPPAAGMTAAPGTAVAAAGNTPVPPTPTPATPTAKPAEQPKPVEVARVDSGTKKSTGSRTGTGSRTSTGGDEPAPRVAQRPATPEVSDDEFDELFGTKKSTKREEPASRGTTPSTYVPPAPGSAKVQERLSQSDVMQVVLNNKPAIVKCVNEQKKKDPSMSGKLVMRWTIQTSGKTSAISCQSPEFKSTYMAKCIGDLIKTWTFPKHQKQGDPIIFPFTF